MSNIEEVWAGVEDLALGVAKASIADAAAKVYKEIVNKTPTDKFDAQQGWEIDYGYGFSSPTLFLTVGKQQVIDKDKYVLGTTIVIRNQVPYAFMLEYGGYGEGPKTVGGFSKQAPKGMMRTGALKFRQFLKVAVKRNKL